MPLSGTDSCSPIEKHHPALWLLISCQKWKKSFLIYNINYTIYSDTIRNVDVNEGQFQSIVQKHEKWVLFGLRIYDKANNASLWFSVYWMLSLLLQSPYDSRRWNEMIVFNARSWPCHVCLYLLQSVAVDDRACCYLEVKRRCTVRVRHLIITFDHDFFLEEI